MQERILRDLKRNADSLKSLYGVQAECMDAPASAELSVEQLQELRESLQRIRLLTFSVRNLAEAIFQMKDFDYEAENLPQLESLREQINRTIDEIGADLLPIAMASSSGLELYQSYNQSMQELLQEYLALFQS